MQLIFLLDLDYYKKYVLSDLNIDWQYFFDLLVRKEIFIHKEDNLVLKSTIFKDVLLENLQFSIKTSAS